MNSRPGHSQPDAFKKGRILAVALAVLAIGLSCTVSIPFISINSPTPVPTTGAASPTLTSPTAGAAGPTNTPDAALIPNTGAAPQGLIAFVGIDGNIYTVDQDGKHQSAVTQDANLNVSSGQTGRIYQYPTWAPDGQKLAFVGFSRSMDQTSPQASLYSALANGSQRTEVFSSPDSLPFYLFWSPNSQSISFLSNGASGTDLEMHVSAAAGGNSQLIGTGQPYYWDWSPDNQTIIAHTGGSVSDNPDARLALIAMDGSLQQTELELKPGPFQAPAWSPTGDQLALTTQDATGAGELVLAGKDGKVKQKLAQLNGPVAFGWSPQGGSLAYTTLVLDAITSNPSMRLILLDPSHPDQGKQVVQASVIAFFWSPDGKKIAYFLESAVPSGPSARQAVQPVAQRLAQTTPQLNLSVQVYDLASDTTKQVAVFAPTSSFQNVLPFYDQYQRSGTIWSPDSQNLVLAGFDSAGDESIFVVGADGGQFHKIADGDVAFWSWK